MNTTLLLFSSECLKHQQKAREFCHIVSHATPIMSLPPANGSLGQGNVFKPVCHSVQRGVSKHAIGQGVCPTMQWALGVSQNAMGWGCDQGDVHPPSNYGQQAGGMHPTGMIFEQCKFFWLLQLSLPKRFLTFLRYYFSYAHIFETSSIIYLQILSSSFLRTVFFVFSVSSQRRHIRSPD